MTIPTHILDQLKHLRQNTNVEPVRDWLVIITLSGILLAGSIVWNVWAFDTVANGGVIGTVAQAPQSFDSTSLNIIHTIFTDRANEEAKYVTGVYRYIDPSQ